MTNKSRISVRFYADRNLGDDLFLKILINRYSDIVFETIVPSTIYGNFNELNNLKLLKKNRLLNFMDKVLRKIFHCRFSLLEIRLLKNNICIYIGGSIFMLNHENFNYIIKLSQHRMYRKYFDKYLILGSNFGPYDSEQQLIAFKDFFQTVDCITFRDNYSYDLFRDNPHAAYYPDIIFNLDNSKYSISEDYILISVIDLKFKSGEPGGELLVSYLDCYKEKLIEIIEYYIRRKQRVVLMSFCENQGDYRFCEELYEVVDKHELVSTYNYDTIDNALQTIANAKKVIATRFHAMILAMVFRKPCLVLSYSQKTTNVIQTVAPEQTYYNIQDMNQIDVSNIENLYYQLDENTLRQLKREAQGHFKYLDQLLTTKGV